MKKLISFAITSIFSVLLLSARAPKWTYEPYKVYPTDKYFVGAGIDKNQNDSELQAVKTIAQIFGQDVHSLADANEHSSEIVDNNIAQYTSERDFNQKIQVLVDQKDLIGIEIVENYFDDKKGEWYTLAVMNLEETSKLYETLIKRNEEAIKNLEQYIQNDNMFLSYSYLEHLCDLITANDFYLKRLFVVNNPLAYSLSKTMTVKDKYLGLLDDLSSRMLIKVSVTNDIDNILNSSLTELLTDAKLNVGNKENCKYELKVTNVEEVSKTSDGKNITFYNYSVNMEMIDKDSNAILFSTLYSGREGASNLEKAKQKAKYTFENKVTKAFITALDNYKHSLIDVEEE